MLIDNGDEVDGVYDHIEPVFLDEDLRYDVARLSDLIKPYREERRLCEGCNHENKEHARVGRNFTCEAKGCWCRAFVLYKPVRYGID